LDVGKIARLKMVLINKNLINNFKNLLGTWQDEVWKRCVLCPGSLPFVNSDLSLCLSACSDGK